MAGTQYPSNVDTNITLPRVVDNVSPILAKDHNQLQEAILAIEVELGTNPSGTAGTVKDRLDGFDDDISTIAVEIDTLTAADIAVQDIDGYFTIDNVEAALRQLAGVLEDIEEGAVNFAIGDAEDGDYTDGLFTDFAGSTTVGTAVDRFNEVLKSLAPPPAPSLSNISYTTSAGSAGKVSFGASNVISGYTSVGNQSGESTLDVNGTFANNSTARRGIYTATFGSKSGVLAGSVTADTGTPNPSYVANAFGNGDSGTLEIFVNGTLRHSVNLAIFSSGTTATSGTGFTLSAATNNLFSNGDSFTLFKYRTGTWTVATTHERNGYNFVQIKHVVGSTTHSTNFFEWVIDSSVTATSFSSESMSSLSMTGSKFLSGVKYHTSGTATYAVTISNAYRNTYSSSSTAVSHTPSNCTISSSAIPSLGGAPFEASTIAVSKTATVASSIRILNSSFSTTTSVDRTVQSDLTSGGASESSLLVDNISASGTAISEPIDGEAFRVPSNRSLSLTTGFTSGGASLWDSTLSITTGGAGYNDGLLVYSDALFYPSSGSVTNSGNFSTITNGYANPNYSAATGTRTYWRYFFFSTTTQNFVLNLAHSGVTFKAASASLTLNSGDAHLELLAPNTTVNGSSTVEFKDCLTAYTVDTAIGCFAATFGSTQFTSYGLTIGSKSTATSGSAVILRVTVPQGWTGSVTSISLSGA